VSTQVPLEEIPYVDYPELQINKNESTEMPFRYVKGSDGQSIMPDVGNNLILYQDENTDIYIQGMIELIKKDSEKGFGDLF
jgi:ribosome biogenesis SPOUT family RNA methylase Rps3